MDRETELTLIDQVLDQIAANTPHMSEHGGSAPVSDYVCPERYAKEITSVFRGLPVALAHVDEIPAAGDYILREITGLSVIVTRCADGVPRAFLNACRHRGSRLLTEPKGNTRVIVCPYHSWSYRDGALVGMPGAQGFCDHDPKDLGLLTFPSTERYGLVWVQLDARANPNWDEWFATVDDELGAFDLASHHVFSVREVVVEANWKAISDAFMEGYHFRFVHKNSVFPLYHDNQGVFTPLGVHYRYFLAHRSMSEQASLPREKRKLRPNCLMVYTLFPLTNIQVLPDHVFVHNYIPLGPDRCIVRNMMLIPTRTTSEKATAHWEKNKAIVQGALDEDHRAAEEVYRGISSGINPDVVFGRFEQGIVHMHHHLNEALAGRLSPT
jgi:phenylpropionate dioxygenase-like ring-hydroxylating dioxygenase large terminal subunit